MFFDRYGIQIQDFFWLRPYWCLLTWGCWVGGGPPFPFRLDFGGEEANIQPFDSATKGSSAAHSALFRNFAAEVAMWLGRQSAGVLNDYHNFFDAIDIPTLVSKAIESNFPARELAIALQQHLAP